MSRLSLIVSAQSYGNRESSFAPFFRYSSPMRCGRVGDAISRIIRKIRHGINNTLTIFQYRQVLYLLVTNESIVSRELFMIKRGWFTQGYLVRYSTLRLGGALIALLEINLQVVRSVASPTWLPKASIIRAQTGTKHVALDIVNCFLWTSH